MLKNHIGSKYVLENIAGNNKELEKLVDPMLYVKSSKAKKIIITCSIYDKHYRKHIAPFVNMFTKSDPSVDLEILLYSRPDLGKGHVALPEKEALDTIFRSLDFLES